MKIDKLRLINLIIYAVGTFLICYYSHFFVGIGVFLMLWANNIERNL